LSGIQNDLGPKGLQVVEAAINDNPDVPGFIERFKPTFPVGVAEHLAATEFMQLSPVVRAYVPFMAFVDRAGMIRSQYTGGDAFLLDEAAEEKNIRAQVEKLLNEHPKSAVKPARRVGNKK